MKIAFVNDAYERIGVEYLSAVLKTHGHQTKLFLDPQLFNDENMSLKFMNQLFDFRKNLVEEIVDYQPDLIGFSVVTDFYSWACETVKMIKDHIDVPIIFGGIHPTSVPERVLANTNVDMVLIGEGEDALLELADSMEKGSINYSTRNVWFKREGEVIRNQLRPLVQNLDSLPFPDKELYYEASPHFKTSYFTITSRGCPYSCSYCCHSYLRKLNRNNGRYVRKRGVDNVLREIIEGRDRWGINFVRFHDDIFTLDKKWIVEFLKRYKLEVRLPFACFVHPKSIDEDLARLLKDAGCVDVEIGVQSCWESTRKKILNRHVTNSSIKNAIALLKDQKIKITTDNILSLPGQAEEEVQDLARFYNENRVDRIFIFGLRYYPKTDIIYTARDMKILSDNDIETLENGIQKLTFVRGGDTNIPQFRRFAGLFSILLYLPVKINSFIIDKKLYRYFPPLPFTFLVIFSNWLRFNPKYNWMFKRNLSRYLHFIAKKIFNV